MQLSSVLFSVIGSKIGVWEAAESVAWVGGDQLSKISLKTIMQMFILRRRRSVHSRPLSVER